MTNRIGENGTVPARTERLFKEQGYWYYSTREGMNIGPFDQKADAQQGAAEFIEYIAATEPEIIDRISDYVSHVA